jgi:hypothetical protein
MLVAGYHAWLRHSGHVRLRHSQVRDHREHDEFGDHDVLGVLARRAHTRCTSARSAPSRRTFTGGF